MSSWHKPEVACGVKSSTLRNCHTPKWNQEKNGMYETNSREPRISLQPRPPTLQRKRPQKEQLSKTNYQTYSDLTNKNHCAVGYRMCKWRKVLAIIYWHHYAVVDYSLWAISAKMSEHKWIWSNKSYGLSKIFGGHQSNPWQKLCTITFLFCSSNCSEKNDKIIRKKLRRQKANRHYLSRNSLQRALIHSMISLWKRRI